MRCELIGCEDALAALLDEDAPVSFGARSHLRACDGCRHALARHRRLQADLQRLGHAPVPGERRLAGDALVAAILAGLDDRDRVTRRLRWIGRCAVAGAVAGGVAAGVVAASRGRRPLLALG